ncbi:MAG TPA: NAD(P)-dependent oxidoreductase [Terrimicrobiaceae bacterium]
MKRVLLTGASGMIAQHCLPILLARGFEVHAISHRTPLTKIDRLFEHHVDLLDPGAVRSVVNRLQATHLLHLAWSSMPNGWAAETKAEASPWVEGSMTLIREFVDAGGQHILGGGTCAEYDWSRGRCSEDETPIQPLSIYGFYKDVLHRALISYCCDRDVRHKWARIFFVYGPHEKPWRLVPSVIRSLLNDEIAHCSHGNQLRDYLYVEDVAQALVGLLESDVVGTFNVGSGHSIRVRDLVMEIAANFGLQDLIRFGALKPSGPDAPLVVADTQRITDALGWRPQYQIQEGIARTISWWRMALPIKAPSLRRF